MAQELKGVSQIQASEGAFAAILSERGINVVTWGLPEDGGYSGSVRDQLQNVQQIQAMECCEVECCVARYSAKLTLLTLPKKELER